MVSVPVLAPVFLWPRNSKIDRYAALRMLVTGGVVAATAIKRIVARATFENVATSVAISTSLKSGAAQIFDIEKLVQLRNLQ